MADGKILQQNQPYSPANPANYPGVAPGINAAALDSLAALVNYKNPSVVYVDITNGSDVTGTGAELRPYQTLEHALTILAGAPLGEYIIALAPGGYGSAPITWPTQLGKNISMKGNGSSINVDINFTSVNGGNDQVGFDGINMAGGAKLIFDFGLAAVSTVILSNGGYAFDRIDTLPPGPQALRVWNSLITTMSTSSVVIMNNCQWIGGPANVIAATGFALMNGCLFASMNGVVDGTLALIATFAQGTTLTGAGTVSADASSLMNLSITGPTVSLADVSQYVGFAPANPGDWVTPPTQVKQALDELAAASAPSANPKTQFVFQPGGAASGNIYTSFATLYAALSAIAGPKTIFFDDSIVSPCVIPAGAYNFAEVTFDAAVAGKFTQVQVANGVTWTNLRTLKNLNLDFLTTAPVESLAQVGIIMEGVQITANGTGSIWSVPVGAQFQLTRGSSFAAVGGISSVVDIATGQSLQLVLAQVASVDANSISSPAADPSVNLIVLRPDETGGFTAQGAQFGGTTIDQPLNNAEYLKYVPAVPGNWVTPPTQVSEALDELAAAVPPAGGANVTLSNLNPTSINQDLVADADNTRDLGSTLKKWKDGHFAGNINVDGTINFTPTTPADWPAPVPTTLEGALDTTAAQISSINTKLVFVDIVRGSDVTGTGSELRPFQTLPAAVAYVGGAGPGAYTIMLAPGNYAGAPVALTGNINLQGNPNTTTISHALSYTAVAADNASMSFFGVGFSTPITIDCSLGNSGVFVFENCGVQLTRVDTNPQVFLTMVGCGVTSLDLTGNAQIHDSLVAGPVTVQAASNLVVWDSVIVSGPINVIGSIILIGADIAGLAVTGAGTALFDSTTKTLAGLAGGSITTATQSLLDDAQTVAFAPAVPGDWTVVPTQVKQALDELAARPLPGPTPGLSAVLTASNDGGAQNIKNVAQLRDSADVLSYDVDTRSFNAADNSPSASMDNRQLKDSTGPIVLDWGNQSLIDLLAKTSLLWKLRQLIATDGATVMLDWSGANLDANTHELINLVDPTTAQAAATRNYVDNHNVPAKFSHTLDGTDIANQYIDLTTVAVLDSILFLWNQAQPPLEGDDYTVSYTGGAGGKTRISFVAGGVLATFAAAGQKVQINHLVQA